MRYIEGFVAAVPAANKEAYRKHAAAAAPLFGEFGATRMVECWGDDVPEGKVNDFRSSVKAKEDEVVVFSWLEYPSKEARDAANEKIRSDPRMQALGDMPFDGQRMIFAGFEPIVQEGGNGTSGYVDGFLVPVPEQNREAYREKVRGRRPSSWTTAPSASSRPGAMTSRRGRSPISAAPSLEKRARRWSSPGSNGRRRRPAPPAGRR